MASKKEYSIEEHLYEMLLELHRLGCSEPFRLPVDAVALKALNYYDVILEPMDLSSLMANYKDGIYSTIEQVNRQLKLIISNCRLYNKIPGHFILKQCDKFENCYQTRWAKFTQQRIAMGVPDDYILKVDVSKLDQMEFRKNRKKESTILAAEIQPKQKAKPQMTFELKQPDQIEKQEKEELGTSIRIKIDKGFQQENSVELPEFLKEKDPKPLLQKSQSLQHYNQPQLQKQTSVKVEQQKSNIVKLPFLDIAESTKVEQHIPQQQIIKQDMPPPPPSQQIQQNVQQSQVQQQFVQNQPPQQQTNAPSIFKPQSPIKQPQQQVQQQNQQSVAQTIFNQKVPTDQQIIKSANVAQQTQQSVAQTIFNQKIPSEQQPIKSTPPQNDEEGSTKVKFSLALNKPQIQTLEKQKSSGDKKQYEYDPLKITEHKIEENIRKKSIDPPPKVQFPFDVVDSTKFKLPVNNAYDPLKPLQKPIDKVQKNEKPNEGQVKIENKKIDKEPVYDPLKNTTQQQNNIKLQDFKQDLKQDSNNQKESFKVSLSKQQIIPPQQQPITNYGQVNTQSFQSPMKIKNDQETTPFSSQRAKKKIVDSDEESKPSFVPKPLEFKQIQKIKYTFKIDIQQSKALFEENQQKKQDKLRRFILKLFQRIKINLDQQKINEKVFSYQTLLKCLEYPYQENVNLLIQWIKSEVVPLPFNHQASIYRYGQIILKYCKQFKEPGDSEYKLYEKQFLDQLAKDIEDLKNQAQAPPPLPQVSTIQSITISQNQIKIKPIQENKVPQIKEFSYDVLKKYLKKIIPKQLKDKLNKVQEPEEAIKVEPFDLIIPEQKIKKIQMEVESDSEIIEQPVRKLVKFDKEVVQLNPIFNKICRSIDAVEINDKLIIKEGDHYPILKVSGINFFIINKNQKFYSSNEQFIQSMNDLVKQNQPRDQQNLETQFASLSYIYCDKKRYCDLYELYKFDNFVEIDINLEFATKIIPKPNLQFNITNIVSYQTQNNFINYKNINHKYQLHIAQSEFQSSYINQNLYQVNEQFLKIMDGNLIENSYAYHLSEPYQESECKFKILGTFLLPFTLLSDLVLTLDSQQIFPLKRISKI